MAAATELLDSTRFGYLKPKDVARLAEAYRFSEAAHAGLIRLYARAGSRSRALAQWDTLVATLRVELDAAPATTTRTLRDAIAAGQFPATEASSTPPGRADGNLPIPLTPLIGRKHGVEAVACSPEVEIPHRFLLFPDEGHGWRKTPNRVRSTTEIVSFFVEHLKPRATAAR